MRAGLKVELKGGLRAELRAELKVELKGGLRAELRAALKVALKGGLRRIAFGGSGIGGGGKPRPGVKPLTNRNPTAMSSCGRRHYGIGRLSAG